MTTPRRTAREIIDVANARVARKSVGLNNWGARHNQAYANEVRFRSSGYAVVQMIEGAALYADKHARRFETPIGFDGVLGEGFAQILQGIRTLLNGDLGALDAGTLDGMICDIAREHGINPDTWELWYEPSAERADNENA